MSAGAAESKGFPRGGSRMTQSADPSRAHADGPAAVRVELTTTKMLSLMAAALEVKLIEFFENPWQENWGDN